jgi:hypothetical protein
LSGPVIVKGFGAEDDTERHEKKANNLMPKTMDRFDDGGNDVLEKRTSLLDGQPLFHNPIVTKAQLAGLWQYRAAPKVPIDQLGNL